MKSKGFTLIELMIIVSIIGILFSIAIPNFLIFQCRAHGLNLNIDKEVVEKICSGPEDNDEKFAILDKRVPYFDKELTDVKLHDHDIHSVCNKKIDNLESQIKSLKAGQYEKQRPEKQSPNNKELWRQ